MSDPSVNIAIYDRTHNFMKATKTTAKRCDRDHITRVTLALSFRVTIKMILYDMSYVHHINVYNASYLEPRP